jgi:hypothetical protein
VGNIPSCKNNYLGFRNTERKTPAYIRKAPRHTSRALTINDQKQIQALAQRMLVQSAHKLGGVAALAKHLGLGEGTVGEFIQGKLVPPAEVILKAIEPLIDSPASEWRDPPAQRPDALKADK